MVWDTMLRLVITTCDKYHHHLRVMLHQLQKYWRPLPDITIVGFKHPEFALPDGVEFYSVGDVSDYPINRWTDAVIAYLRTRPLDEVFVLALDDYYLVRPVDNRMVVVLRDYMRQFGYVIKMDLAEDRLHAYGTDLEYGEINYEDGGHIDLIKSDPKSQYHASLWPGLWRNEHLLRLLLPGQTPWQVEIDGTVRLRNMTDVIVLGTKQSIVEICLGARGGNGAGEMSISGLKVEDQDELKSLGYV